MKPYTLLLLVFSSTLCFSQSAVKKANRLFQTKAYTSAAEVYGELLADNTELDLETLLQAADTYHYIKEPRQAAQLYEKAYNKNDKDLGAPFLYRYYQSLRGLREYEKADALYRKFLLDQDKSDALAQYENAVQQFDSLRNDATPSQYSLRNLDINTEYSEFAPVFYKEGIIFSSSRPGASKELYAWNRQPYLSLFVANENEEGNLEEVRVFSKQIGTQFHDATLAFVPNSDEVFFTSSNVKKNKLILDAGRTNNFKIYRGRMSDNKIVEKEELHFNSNTYSVGHPAVSSDGKYLLFASDMPGGFGGADIYYCRIYEDGMISDPVNAGSDINTWGNDFFPYVVDDMLFFASDGHVGFGGLDLYEVSFTPNIGLGIPKNLGKNINSVGDDFGFILNSETNTGYVSSNRVSGMGDDDIYHFNRVPPECNQWVIGNVKDITTQRPIFNVTVVAKDSIGNTVETTVTDAAGDFIFSQPCEEPVVIVASKNGYYESEERAYTGKENDGKTEGIDIWMKNAEEKIIQDANTGEEKIDLAAIFFEYDKSEVTSKAAAVLDEAVNLMKKYPEMIIKIEAHTDARGSAEYNRSLSDRRAKATRDYLYAQGVATNRIVSAIGFGESQLLNECSDGISCDETMHSKNRRSNFIILKR
ncbi:MAG: flagellar motor protein MotB [Flavobacteriaceae bacterium]|nr:flagellar motor protein MotB [Flavobacteriaceae bacterium]|tara:strand:- start:35565 stop:37502 length:1938 start_codon:yes stop_codon:yes gene_type:complete